MFSQIARFSLPALVACAALPVAGAGPSHYEKVLRDHNIPPTTAGLSAYLEELHPSAEQQRRAARLIDKLGSADSFTAREAAMTELLAMPVQPAAALRAAARSEDPEVRWRARKVLRLASPQGERILYAAFMTIKESRLPGLVQPVVKAIPRCDKDYLRRAAGEALAATARPGDAQRLRRASSSEDIEVRVAAIGALGRVLGADSANDLRPLLEHSNDRVTLAAARAMASYGDRRSLPPLVELLSSSSVEVRAASGATLRELTGVRFGLAAYDKAEKRQEPIEKWRKWVAANGKTAKLHFPLRPAAAAEIGHTIISAYAQNRVIVLDEQKQQILEIAGHSGPWGTQRLANGNYLVNWYGSSCVVEYDSLGKEVWKFQRDGVSSPWSAQRLPNGNTLIAHSNFALEVDPDGKTVWQRQFESTLSQAIRLDNGHTLAAIVTGDGRVVEIDASGEEVFQIAGLKTPYRIQRLPNGNTLVVEKGRGRVVEFDPTGRAVWSHGGLSSPDGAHRLGNGNTLVCDSQGVYEISPSGKVIWKRPGTQSLVLAY